MEASDPYHHHHHERETPVLHDGSLDEGSTAETDPSPQMNPITTPAPSSALTPNANASSRSFQSASGPASSHTLTSVRSQPVLLPSRPGTVRDMASRFDRSAAPSSDHPALTLNTADRDRFRRPSAPGKTTAPRSPVSASSGEGKDRMRLQKKRPGHVHRSPGKSPATSFEANSSFSSVSTTRTTRSQPHSAFSPKNRPQSPAKQTRPLFGEITADGRWNGNFELGNYGPLPTFEKAPRRGSEGSLALGHGRSHSHADISMPSLAPPSQYRLSHKRSRSDMDLLRPQAVPSMPDLGAHAIPTLYIPPTPPDSGTRTSRSRPPPTTSRIPVSSRQSTDSASSFNNPPYSRSASSMSNHRRKRSKSPTRPSTARGKENSTSFSRNRYVPPPLPTASANQLLSAKIVAPLPKTSPPLRSSRPRQPVSAATTSASRARAAERFVNPNANSRDARRPSEQWLGKPYDPQKERSRRKIPELDKVDFASRRARIQKAITASLKSNDSYEGLRSASRSQSRSQTRGASREPTRITSREHSSQVASGAERRLQQESIGTQDAMSGQIPALIVETSGLQMPSNTELLTAQTEKTMFEDESPVLGRPAADTDSVEPQSMAEGPPILLAPATYRPLSETAGAPHSIEVDRDAPAEEVQSPSVLDNVMRMRARSASDASNTGTEFADDSPSIGDSASDVGDKWGLGNGLGADQGSIRIMLDEEPNTRDHSGPWPKDLENSFDETHAHTGDEVLHAHAYNEHVFAANGFVESPIETNGAHTPEEQVTTPRRNRLARDDTLRPTVYSSDPLAHSDEHRTVGDDGTIARVLEYYQSTGSLTAGMLEEMQHRMVDLHRISANGGSNGIMIQSLLDSIMDSQVQEHRTPEKQRLQPEAYEMPLITPDTPPMGAGFVPGTVIVYGNDSQHEQHEQEEDFEAKIRKADEAWERQQRGEDPFAPDDDESRPTPPPKDIGYTPRSSVGPSSGTYTPSATEGGLRLSTISTTGGLDLHDIHAAADRASLSSLGPQTILPEASSAPPLPSHSPPPVPPGTALKPSALPDLSSAKAFSERASSELSPRLRKSAWGQSSSSRPPSSRPSMDSQRIPPSLPGSQSMTSVSETTRVTSVDTGVDGSARQQKATSPGPEQKRLLRRRHIIKELLDTENSYHQDLKIIEDIYKATCTPELVQPEDKKVLFGNCDEVEKFALHFYDEMRKAVSQVYTPPKHHRWMNKRGSFSTTQSDSATGAFTEAVDDEKDQTTTIGRAFLMNITQMENVYGSYLKNHDAANQRLSAIQGTTTVKCWLDECHANASDITSAWDLDSLLVKPTQRVAKYPMLLQQLLEVTPAEHPDHADLKSAAKDSIAMLTRINDAKKRADLVDQIINPGRRKDTDIRSGLAKAFGRRTEKLKERVGIAEAFQDPAFDDLAHKFGGHFIRLQICMRDVQDYMHRTDKAIELINNYANALELFTDVSPSTLPEIESKFRKYGQVIRDLTLIAFGEHKADVQKRVLAPMIQCIKLHEGPQNAINKRKKRIVDYAKCKSDERRGQKPDKKTQEASDIYVALNEQLKIDLPKLYTLTAQLVQNCLHCFIDIQLMWQSTWERKLKPLLEAADIPQSIQQIEPAFRLDFVEIEKRCNVLSICNGTLKVEAASFLSPQTTLVDPSETSTRRRRPSTLDSSKRTMSVGSESADPNNRRHSGIDTLVPDSQSQPDTRMRSNSAMAARQRPSQTPASSSSASRPWSNSNTHTPSSSFSATRPATADSPLFPMSSYFPRQSNEVQRVHRPASDATYYTARPTPADVEQHRFSGLFNSALPPDDSGPAQEPLPSRTAPDDQPILFVCASLFEFSIDRTRKEGGYPYLQYVQGEVFDVVAQKGELWLAKNQDDSNNELGWIWEQHFIILSSEN
ncbi:putative DH domain, BAR domain, AH/BAR domain superfamily protein [Septoria linicola]|nr:putative DH domain, BAR domain, AH/BAR domain superfamily protein [Septoria linicola]